MALYNEALALAPQYAETYRQRALTLLRLGDRVQAQVDYGRFLELDPQARGRTRDEIQLYAQSGYARVGETEVALSRPHSACAGDGFARGAFDCGSFACAAWAGYRAVYRPPVAYNPAKQSETEIVDCARRVSARRL